MAKKTDNEYGDFGRKIGNARKDLAGFRKNGGFDVDDIAEWADGERSKHIVKKEVFVKPDFQKLYDSGEYEREALFFQSQVYKALPPAPVVAPYLIEAKRNGTDQQEAVRQAQNDYIRMMKAFRVALADVKDKMGILAFTQAIRQIHNEDPTMQKALQPYYSENFTRVSPWNKLNKELVSSNWDYASLMTKMSKAKFLYNEEEKALSQVEVFHIKDGTVYNEYRITATVSGTIPFEGGDPEEAFRDSRARQRLSEPTFEVGEGELKISGKAQLLVEAKNEAEAFEKAEKEFKALADPDSPYPRFGELQGAAFSDFEREESSRDRLCVKHGGTSYFYGMKDKPEGDPMNYQTGKYMAMVSYRSDLPTKIIGFNYDTQEEAKQAAIQYVQTATAAKKAIKDAIKKGALNPPQLLHIHRVGEDYLDGGDVEIRQKRDENGELMWRKNADGSVETDRDGKPVGVYECPAFQETFGFSAGEFGNWENQNDRRVNLNMAFEAFKDMTKAIGIAESDVSLGEQLALAWGSRGKGGAHAGAAHFEPDANVINLTKMNGAGALGHEWGHALDYAIARTSGRAVIADKGMFETDTALRDESSVLHKVVNAMMYKPDGSRTEYYKDAVAIDEGFSRADKGYWKSSVEMFARAFHTYLLDKMKEEGVRNDYLCGHAEMSPIPDKDGKMHYTYPRGEERERINQEFDKVIEVLKEKGFFHEHGYEPQHQLVHSQDGVGLEESAEQVKEALEGQLEFDLSEPEKKPKKEKGEQEKQVQEAADSESSSTPSPAPANAETEEKTEPEYQRGTISDAARLKVGDIIQLDSSEAINAATMKREMLPSEFAKVVEASEDHIEFVTSSDPAVPDSWMNGRMGYSSTGDEHWSDKLAHHGFDLVSIQPEEMHIVYLRSDDETKLEAMKKFIDLSYGEHANWNDEKNAVELPDTDFKNLQNRVQNPNLGAFMKDVLANVELGFDEPLPERPDHTVYLQGDMTDLLVLNGIVETNEAVLQPEDSFKVQYAEDMKSFVIKDKDLDKYLDFLQSEKIQGNPELMKHLSVISQQVDAPFPQSPDKFFTQVAELDESKLEKNENGTYSQSKSFQIGEHIAEDGSILIVEPITVSIEITASDSPQGVHSGITDFSYKVGDELITDLTEEVPKDAKRIVEGCINITSEIAHENAERAFAADKAKAEAEKQAQEGAKKPMADENKGWRQGKTESDAPQKKSFPTAPNLKKLEETMKEHKPFAIMAMSTSGIDSEAEPIRAVVQEYTYDEELHRYQQGMSFDRMVQCSPEQLDKMLTSKEYDYFGNAGIDKDAYVRGEGVLSKEDFSKEFTFYMKALEQDEKTLLIINGGASFAEGQLAKVSPEAKQAISDKAADRTAVSQTTLTGEYFKRHDIHAKLTLENLRDEITPIPTGSFRPLMVANDPQSKDLKQSFETLSKEEFMKAAHVTSAQYDATVADIANHEAKIIGADARVEMIAKFVETDGRERGILESEFNAHWREADVMTKQQRSEEGKQKYENADYAEKLETLVRSHAVEPEVVLDRDSDCDLNKLLNVMEKKGVDGDGHNKGFVVMQAATTGFDSRGVGEPIQVSAIAFNLGDDGSITPADGISEYNIKASDRAVMAALSSAEKGRFDAFAYTGIDAAEYRAGKDVHSQEEALKTLAEFFKNYPPEDYPILSNGGGKNDPSLTTSQEALLYLGNLKAFADSHNSVDFTQAIKEYCYVAYHGEQVQSVIANEDSVKKFGLPDIVAANDELAEVLKQTQPEGRGILDSTLQKVNATSILADAIRVQDMELHRPELFAALTQSQQEELKEDSPAPAPVKTDTERTAPSQDSAPVVSPYDGTTASTKGEQEAVDLDDVLEEDSGLSITDLVDKEDLAAIANEGEDTREHGNLYSDKKGDKRDVVIVEGSVTKIAEVEIPHVSEAPQQEQNKPAPAQEGTQKQEAAQPDKEESRHRMADRQREHRRRSSEKPRVTPTRADGSSASSPAPAAAPQPAAQSTDREAELLAIIKSQQEMMKAMQADVSAMREEMAKKDQLLHGKENTINLVVKQLANAMEKQTELMVQIAGIDREEPAKDYKSMSASERADAIDKIKEEIVAIKEAVPTGSRESLALSNANMQLSNAQKHMEQERPIPNKAG